jgi:serine protease Do
MSDQREHRGGARLRSMIIAGAAVAGAAEGPGLQGAGIDLLDQENRSFAEIARTVTPSIANIQTTQVIKVQESPFFNDPFFRQFFGERPFSVPREQREHALGSGVIVSRDGYVVTNNHVIAHGTDIRVMLPDRRIFKAEIVGADPDTDVAVIKIDAKGLPAATWGDSSTLQAGNIVMAFGNPFGLNFTVTRGSVSAIGRSGLGIESFEDFIQTDAPINPGNSGGALVDVHGRVVGINTAIVSPGGGKEGGFAGVGFAIPSNVVKAIMVSLVKSGKVERGYLGVEVADLDEELARQFKAPDLSGALVQDVSPNSPAAKAGLEPGDVVRTLDGRHVESKDTLTFLVASSAPGKAVSLGILRDGRALTLKVTLGKRPARIAPGGMGKAPSQGTLRGISVQDLNSALRSRLGLPGGLSGVVVGGIDPASPAGQEGLQAGDVILEIDRHPVRNASDFERLAAHASGEVLVRIYRQGVALFVVLTPLSEGGQ